MSVRLLAACAAAGAALFGLLSLHELYRRRLPELFMPDRRERVAFALRRVVDEGRIDVSFGGRRVLLCTIAAGALVGFALLGFPGAIIGLVAAPAGLRSLLRSRRRRYAARVDACAPELALALASALAAGRSVRGALLTAGAATSEPLARELDRVAVDLTLGQSIGDALAALRSRTGSARIESLAGAIELHRGSGGDLVRLTRELSDAFRARDRAMRDARSASAQARFTAIIVAAIPLVFAGALELASPGSVTGAFKTVPTAAMLAVSVVLMVVGVALAQRLAAVRA